jgi:hypothetical protein
MLKSTFGLKEAPLTVKWDLVIGVTHNNAAIFLDSFVIKSTLVQHILQQSNAAKAEVAAGVVTG